MALERLALLVRLVIDGGIDCGANASAVAWELMGMSFAVITYDRGAFRVTPTAAGRNRVAVWEIDLRRFDRHGSSIGRDAFDRLASAGLVHDVETPWGPRPAVTSLGRRLLAESHHAMGRADAMPGDA